MGRLFFIGMGLNDAEGITLTGLRRAKGAGRVYVEFYTNIMPHLSLKRLESALGRDVLELKRGDLEDLGGEMVLRDAQSSEVALLIPGDPMAATTHVELRLKAQSLGVETEVVYGVSILTAAPSALGLQIYKFGRPVTIPFPTPIYRPLTPYQVVEENTSKGLHSLVLLDVDAEGGRFMKVGEGLDYLSALEAERGEGVVPGERLAAGLARVGGEDASIRGGRVAELKGVEFGGPPHLLILPGRLHFKEAEALRAFAGVGDDLLREHDEWIRSRG